MFIRITLLSLAFAFALLVAAKLLFWLRLSYLAEAVTWLGLMLLFLASVVFIFIAALALIRSLWQALRGYFSAPQRHYRQLLFLQLRQNQLQQLLGFKTQQLRYFHNVAKNRLLAKDNRKQLKRLSKAIDKDLQSLKNQLPKSTFKDLKQQNKAYYRGLNSDALLKLQQHIILLGNPQK